jgi:hypothetical protein
MAMRNALPHKRPTDREASIRLALPPVQFLRSKERDFQANENLECLPEDHQGSQLNNFDAVRNCEMLNL